MNKQKYGFILVDKDSHIVKVHSSATYEQTLDGKLDAVNKGLTYVPLNLMNLIDELSKSEIYQDQEVIMTVNRKVSE